MQRTKRIVDEFSHPLLDNYKVAATLTTMQALSIGFRCIGLDSLSNYLQIATITTGTAFVVNQYGAENTYAAAKSATCAIIGFFGSIANSMNGSNPASSHENLHARRRAGAATTKEDINDALCQDDARVGDSPPPFSPMRK